MPENNHGSTPARPLHLWIVSGVALVWNAVGALDFVMTQTRNEAYMSSFTEEQIVFFYSFPTWVVITWAIAVWGSVLGTLLLLFRKQLAAWVFSASLAGFVVTTFQNYVLSNGLEVVGDAFSLGFSVLIFTIIVTLTVYSFVLRKREILQ